jgi:hypothetical protein
VCRVGAQDHPPGEDEVHGDEHIPRRDDLACGSDAILQEAPSNRNTILDGSGVFTLTADPAIVGPARPLTSAGFFFDQNLDGNLDLFVGYWWRQPPWTSPFGQPPQLYRGNGAAGDERRRGEHNGRPRHVSCAGHVSSWHVQYTHCTRVKYWLVWPVVPSLSSVARP